MDYDGDGRTVDVQSPGSSSCARRDGHNYFRTVRGVGYAFAPRPGTPRQMPVVADELLGDAIEALLGRAAKRSWSWSMTGCASSAPAPAPRDWPTRPSDQLTGMSLIAAFGSVALDGIARQAQASGGAAIGESELAGWARAPSRSRRCRCPAGACIALHETTSQRRAERIRRDFVANISHELAPHWPR